LIGGKTDGCLTAELVDVLTRALDCRSIDWLAKRFIILRSEIRIPSSVYGGRIGNNGTAL
jgi:hypothetical protein